MITEVQMDTLYVPSENVVAREIEGELIIIPLAAGIGDMEDELYTLNDSAKDIWARLDGKNTLRSLVAALALEYDASIEEIERDVLGLVEELLKRRILVEGTGA